MKNSILSLVLLLFVVFGFAQNSLDNNFSYEVNTVYTPLSISKENLSKAQSISDLNSYYKNSWVRTFLSVEILATNNGKLKKAVTKDDTLSQEQKELMKKADAGTDISVHVYYMPENTLSHNDPKEFDFSFIVNPEKEAEYEGGSERLQKYLKEQVMDKISEDVYREYALSAVKFTITEEGEVTNVHVSQSSDDEKTDDILLEAVTKMPCWKPAEYDNGTKVKQDCVFTVGDHRSCIINLLSVRRD